MTSWGADLTRIIGGVAKGRRLIVPPRGTRPTSDRVHMMSLNILTARLDLTSSAVLDLYAGSGALGTGGVVAGSGVGASGGVRPSAPPGGDHARRLSDRVRLQGATVRRGAVAAVLAAGAPAPVDLVLADPP